MADQLEAERRLVGDASNLTLLKEMVLVPANRKRGLISIALMVCQQMTGVNSIVSRTPKSTQGIGDANVLTLGFAELLRSSDLPESRYDRH